MPDVRVILDQINFNGLDLDSLINSTIDVADDGTCTMSREEFIKKMSELEEMIQPNRAPSLMHDVSKDLTGKSKQGGQTGVPQNSEHLINLSI